MNRNSSGGPDGFNLQFFIHSWDTIKDDFLKAIHNFFTKSKLLLEVNATDLVLIPKTQHPSTVESFRPISCCNVI